MANTIKTLPLIEIYPTLQGEGTYTGIPCLIVRFAGCNLNCDWCDTDHSSSNSNNLSAQEILSKVSEYNIKLILITGGEPLLHEGLIGLIETLHDQKYKIILETNGSLPIDQIPSYVFISLDLKAPSAWSGFDPNDWNNINFLNQNFDLKIVIENENDFLWSITTIETYAISDRIQKPVILQPAFGRLKEETLTKWILQSGLSLRLGLQIHKYIFSDEKKLIHDY